jgi:uncharacterized membrane protein YciS (DUF1049 family)
MESIILGLGVALAFMALALFCFIRLCIDWNHKNEQLKERNRQLEKEIKYYLER